MASYKIVVLFTLYLLSRLHFGILSVPHQVQPDIVKDEWFETNDSNGPFCARVCKEDEMPKICYYRFVLERYNVMGKACGECPQNITACSSPQCISADGHGRSIMSINRKLPGPTIQVCEGDTIIVDLKNMIPDRSTSIHWYGVRQIGTPHMDGVSMITQCPIQSGQIFRYRFKADKAGTYFWHSHEGLQKLDGVIGSLIVRQPAVHDPNSQRYNKDLPSHVLLITDWLHNSAESELHERSSGNAGLIPDTYLINGRGYNSPSLLDSSIFGPWISLSKTPVSKFIVKRGLRYRFRFIGGTSLYCPFQIHVENHRLELISTDSDSVQPVMVDKIIMSAGDRFDVVLEANQQTGQYWVVVQGLEECKNAKQFAILKYDAPNFYPIKTLSTYPSFRTASQSVTLNPLNSNCSSISEKSLCVHKLKSWSFTPAKVNAPNPDVRILFTYGVHPFQEDELFHSNQYYKFFYLSPNLPVAGMINNISNVLSPSPLLTQHKNIPPEIFCREKCIDMTSETHCQCLHTVKVPLEAAVEFVIVDSAQNKSTKISYPFHLHGYEFYVIELGTFGNKILQEEIQELIERLDSSRQLRMYLPKKDTVDIPASGYAVIRIVANNPGFWMLNCNYIHLLVTGMSVILQVGDLKDLPRMPSRFPTCGDYLPRISS